jgi:hypothetical protein
MILGLSTSAFTFLHVVLSLIGIASGLVVVLGMFRSSRLEGWTALFLTTTVLTSVTGFFFHSAKFGPAHVIGVISLVTLALAISGLYAFHLGGAWRWVYVTGAITALYLNCFVAVVQGFQKVPFLHAFAPKGNEPAFLVAQVVVLLLFIGFTVGAVRSFHPPRKAAALAMA